MTRAELAESDRRIVEGYGAVLGEDLRLAHLALLAWAGSRDRWPAPADVVRFARCYGVPAAPLGAMFGLMSRRVGRRVAWVAVPPSGRLDEFSREQVVAYGFFLASMSLCARERTVH